MINELYRLSKAMDSAGVQVQSWHVNYKPIPHIKPSAPCVRVTISNGKVIDLSAVAEELGAGLRKFGNNQGTYPCMNLAPLYRITDEAIAKGLLQIKPEDIDSDKIEEIKNWCQKNNWDKKFQDFYRVCMVNRADELRKLLSLYEPIQILIEEGRFFLEPMALHKALDAEAFRMLHDRENVKLALRILFDTEKNAEKRTNLSVALESLRLIQMGTPAVSNRFVLELNAALLSAEQKRQKPTKQNETGKMIPDAFGALFLPVPEPMPTVKLAGGFDVTLRTMFHGHPCQTRYGRIEDASYPISAEIRKKLHASLDWLGSAEQENITWTKTDKGEILFVYPAQMPEIDVSYTNMFGTLGETDISFAEQAKQFLNGLKQCRKPGTDSKADRIQLFILRKIDKARVKIIYTRQTDAHELEKCSEAWNLGCSNLPVFPVGEIRAPFPLETANILNRFWKQSGELATDKFRPVPKYHGLELLMEPGLSVTADLHMLSEKAMVIGPFLSELLTVKRDLYHPIWTKIKEMLALMGLLLHRAGIGKERYMERVPYLYGRLLKVSDELHAMYCRVVRKGDLPPQLAGSSAYQAAAEAPLRTLSMLGQRMAPYIAWAKTYHANGPHEKREEVWRAKWLLRMYEEIADGLSTVCMPETRFNDEEKAQLFLGFLAAFPKREQTDGTGDSDSTEEVQEI